jgi:hypothetical protein
MHYISPNTLTNAAFQQIQKCLVQRTSHIPVRSIKGIIHVSPVLVLKVDGNTFHGHFMANPYFQLDLDLIRESMFQHVYKEDGSYNSERSGERITQFTARFQDTHVHHVYMPKILEVGDILLCSQSTFGKINADSEPVLV